MEGIESCPFCKKNAVALEVTFCEDEYGVCAIPGTVRYRIRCFACNQQTNVCATREHVWNEWKLMQKKRSGPDKDRRFNARRCSICGKHNVLNCTVSTPEYSDLMHMVKCTSCEAQTGLHYSGDDADFEWDCMMVEAEKKVKK